MEKNTKFTKKFLIEVGITFAIILPLIAGIFYLRSTIDKKVSAISDHREEIVTKTSQLNSLVSLRAQYNDFASDALVLMRNSIPTKDQLINLSKELEELGSSESIGFGFSFLGEIDSSGDSLGHISFRLNISGDSFSQILSFVNRLENFKYLTKIDHVNIQSGENQMNSTIEAKVFYR